MVDFFHIQEAIRDQRETGGAQLQPRSIGDFCTAHKQYGTPYTTIGALARRFIDNQVFMAAGTRGTAPLMGECYYAVTNITPEDRAYGTYEFMAFGLAEVRKRLSDSVRPLYVTTAKGDESNGTCFLFENDTRLVTARHCIESVSKFSVAGANLGEAGLKSIRVPANPNLDLAILMFERPVFDRAQPIRVGEGELLEPVLTLSYPPIPGFRNAMISERAELAGRQVATTGQTVGRNEAYREKQEYWIVSARVKGGSSGGAALNRSGKLVGVISRMGATSEGPDPLAFGALVPSEELRKFWQDCEKGETGFVELPFELVDGAASLPNRLESAG